MTKNNKNEAYLKEIRKKFSSLLSMPLIYIKTILKIFL